MAGTPTTTLQGLSGSPPDADAILNALAKPVFVINGTDHFTYLNHAGEQFFEASAQSLVGRPLSDSLPADSPVFALIGQVRLGGHSVTEFGVTIETPRIGSHLVGDHFLTERYALWTVDGDGRPRCGRIRHDPWVLRDAQMIKLDDRSMSSRG